jgi:hypothetical protein
MVTAYLALAGVLNAIPLTLAIALVAFQDTSSMEPLKAVVLVM